jgi:hypothetical protein
MQHVQCCRARGRLRVRAPPHVFGVSTLCVVVPGVPSCFDSTGAAAFGFVDGPDGYSLSTLFGRADCLAFTYDDVIFLPGEAAAAPVVRAVIGPARGARALQGTLILVWAPSRSRRS